MTSSNAYFRSWLSDQPWRSTAPQNITNESLQHANNGRTRQQTQIASLSSSKSCCFWFTCSANVMHASGSDVKRMNPQNNHHHHRTTNVGRLHYLSSTCLSHLSMFIPTVRSHHDRQHLLHFNEHKHVHRSGVRHVFELSQAKSRNLSNESGFSRAFASAVQSDGITPHFRQDVDIYRFLSSSYFKVEYYSGVVPPPNAAYYHDQLQKSARIPRSQR